MSSQHDALRRSVLEEARNVLGGSSEGHLPAVRSSEGHLLAVRSPEGNLLAVRSPEGNLPAVRSFEGHLLAVRSSEGHLLGMRSPPGLQEMELASSRWGYRDPLNLYRDCMAAF